MRTKNSYQEGELSHNNVGTLKKKFIQEKKKNYLNVKFSY